MCIFLVSAGLPWDVLRQPQQCNRKQDVIVSEDRGGHVASGKGGRVVHAKMFIFYSAQESLGTLCANHNRAARRTTSL